MNDILNNANKLEKIKNYLAKSRSTNYLENAQNIVNENEFEINPFKFKIENKKENEWIDEEKYSRSLLRLLNGFVFLGDLIDAYLNTKKREFIDKGIEVIYEWYSLINYEEHKNTMAYHDETTALRMEYLISILLNAKEVINEIDRNYIFEKCELLANLLESDEFHSKNTNHGMFQDLALLKYGVIVDNNMFIDKAIKRLNDYFNFVYTSEGVHKEHSPAYHMMVSASLKRYSNFLRDFNIDNTVNFDIKDMLNKAEEFIIHISRPDGCVPNISDTEKRKLISIYPNLFTSNKYKFVLTSGEKGTPPKENSKVFKESGYALFRDSWNKKVGASQVIFTAAYHTGYHKHTDDLNVLFYSGQDILVEAGANGYNYKDPFTKYAYSAYAHNTLNVINKQLLRHDNKMDKVKLIDYHINEEYSMAIGKNERYENTVHTRKVKYYSKTNLLEVVDKIESSDLNQYALNWHFAKGISLAVENEIITLIKDKKEIGIVKIFSDTKYKVNVINGKDKGVVQGWYFEKMENKEPINNIEVRFNSKNAKFVTQIIVYKDNQKEYQKDITYNEKIYLKKKNIKYLLKRNKDSDKLCVVFSAMCEKNKFLYNYMSTLEDCNINKLFILDEFDIQGSYYMGKNRSKDIEESVISLIMNISKELDIKLNDIILIGSSKGGYSALYYGIKYNLGSVIVGAPQSKIGDFLIEQENHLELAKYISGGIESEDKEYLNNILYRVIEENKKCTTKIYIHVGRGDHHYENHVLPLVDEFKINDFKYELDLKEYKTHGEVKMYYPIYIKKILNSIDDSIVNIENLKDIDINTVNVTDVNIYKKEKYIKSLILYNYAKDISECNRKDLVYSFYIYKDGEFVHKQPYGRKNELTYEYSEEGVYKVRGYIRNINGYVSSKYSKEIKIIY